MSLFSWRKSLQITERDPSYKVRYLGNVQTTLMKGEGCVDKPINTIWNSHMHSLHSGIYMKLVVTRSGLDAYTKEQGLTQYRAHRISYCVAHTTHPKLFVWVYRHEGRKMRLEMRCHVVLCKSETVAKSVAFQLHEKLSFALKEFQREKRHKQNSRLLMMRTNSMPTSNGIGPLRKQLLSTAKNFRPPANKGAGAPSLSSIHEDFEEEELDDGLLINGDGCNGVGVFNGDVFIDHTEACDTRKMTVLDTFDLDLTSTSAIDDFNSNSIFDVEIGNDIEQLRSDREVQFCVNKADDSDDESE